MHKENIEAHSVALVSILVVITGVIIDKRKTGSTGMHGHGKQAIDIFERMLQTGLILDLVCFIALLHACSH
jgi:hypothetical protein